MSPESVHARSCFDERSPWHYRRARLRRVLRESPSLPRRLRRVFVHAWQRLTRSWDDKSVWSLSHHVGHTLGAQLVYMADIAHGYPGEYVGGFDAWVADLRRNGELLQRYAEDRLEDIDDLTAYENAKKAMHWVAWNFGALWD